MGTDPTTTSSLLIFLIGLGAFMGLLGGTLGVGLLCKQLFFTKADSSKEYVTRGELEASLAELELELKEFKTEFAAKMDKFENYAHQTAHQTSQSLQTLMLKVQTLLILQKGTKDTRVMLDEHDVPTGD